MLLEAATPIAPERSEGAMGGDSRPNGQNYGDRIEVSSI